MLSQVSQTCIISPLQKKSFANRSVGHYISSHKRYPGKASSSGKKNKGGEKKKSMNQKSLKTTDVCVFVCILAVMSMTVYYEW